MGSDVYPNLLVEEQWRGFAQSERGARVWGGCALPRWGPGSMSREIKKNCLQMCTFWWFSGVVCLIFWGRNDTLVPIFLGWGDPRSLPESTPMKMVVTSEHDRGDTLSESGTRNLYQKLEQIAGTRVLSVCHPYDGKVWWDRPGDLPTRPEKRKRKKHHHLNIN